MFFCRPKLFPQTTKTTSNHQNILKPPNHSQTTKTSSNHQIILKPPKQPQTTKTSSNHQNIFKPPNILSTTSFLPSQTSITTYHVIVFNQIYLDLQQVVEKPQKSVNDTQKTQILRYVPLKPLDLEVQLTKLQTSCTHDEGCL